MSFKKTLAIILHYNTPELVVDLYNSLIPYENNEYELFILDNGSDPELTPNLPRVVKLPTNIYFGGGINIAFELFLKNQDKYDSLLFLNSDLILSGKGFISELRKEMFENDFKIISPAITQPETDQCYWRNMHNHYQPTVRETLWVDFQCPLIHGDVIKEIQQYDKDLIFGWGNDVYSGVVCQENNWKVGVVDRCNIIHLSNYTVKKFNDHPIIKDYNARAEAGMYSFFNKINKIDILHEFRNHAREYTI